MKVRQIVLENDSPVAVPMNTKPFSIRTVCCDCGLVHDVQILSHHPLLSKHTDNDVVLIFTRRDRNTGQRRRWIKQNKLERNRQALKAGADGFKGKDYPII